MEDYYKVLGVDKAATQDEIKKAYKKQASRYHPDRNNGDKVAEEQFKKVNEAYQTLGEPEKRQMYDFGGPSSRSQIFHRASSPLDELLRTMGFNINMDFMQTNPFAKQTGTQKFQVNQQLNVSLYDAIFGKEVEASVPSYMDCVDCSGLGGTKAMCHKCNGAGHTITHLGTVQYSAGCITCNGAGHVLTTTCKKCNREGFFKKTRKLKLKIPAGLQDGSVMRIAPEPGDRCEVFLTIHILKHEKITRTGATLFSNERVSCLDAMVGGKFKIDVIDGEVELEVPAGTQNGQQVVVKGRGGVLSNGRADHIVNVLVDIPVDLTDEQKEKIIEIRDSLNRG